MDNNKWGRDEVGKDVFILVMHLEVTRKGERMTSSKDYLDYILEQLSGLEDIRYRAMMGEIYFVLPGKGCRWYL